MKLPIEDLDIQGKKLLAKLNAGQPDDASHSSLQMNAPGYRSMPSNPDMAAAINKAMRQIELIHNGLYQLAINHYRLEFLIIEKLAALINMNGLIRQLTIAKELLTFLR